MTTLMKATIGELALPAGKTDRIFFDEALSGFGLRLRLDNNQKLRRSFIVQFRVDGRSHRLKIGDAPRLNVDQARKRATELLAKVTLGQDPSDERRQQRQAITFSAAVAEYLALKQNEVRPASFKVMQIYLTGKKYFGGLHTKALPKIDKSDVSSHVNKITTESGTSTAGRARAHLSAFFVWAMKNGHVEQNPVINSICPPKLPARDHVLKNNELAAIWNAALDTNSDIGRIVCLLMLTGCRRQEIGSLTRSEVDFQRATIKIPGSRTKNGVAHTLTLPPLAMEILRSIPQRVGREYFFGERGDGFHSWRDGQGDRFGVANWRIHDLRRTVATGMCEIGIEPHIVEAVLNHTGGHKGGVAGIYNRATYDVPKKTALLRWANHIETIVTGAERKVVALNVA